MQLTMAGIKLYRGGMKKNVWKSVGAIIAGAAAGIVISIGTDAVLYATGVFPPSGQPMPDTLLLLPTIYRTLYGVGSSYLTARLSPSRPMAHAMILGTLGLAANIAGTMATWHKPPALGHEWYPITLVVLALPPAWLGGKIREMQLQSHGT